MDVRGTTLLEYVMIASLVAVVTITGMRAVSSSTSNQWNYVSDTVVRSIEK